MKATLLQSLSLIGLIGGVLMFAGDMFFYYLPIDGNSFKDAYIMSRMPVERLITGGIVGPIAGLLLSIGSFAMYYALKSSNKIIASIILVSFVISFTTGGAFQTLYTFKGLFAKLPAEQRAQCFAFLWALMKPLQLTILLTGLIGTALFILVVILKKTHYPRWVIIFTPILSLLDGHIAGFVPYPFGSIIVGGWTNLCLILFFTVNFLIFRKSAFSMNLIQPSFNLKDRL